MDYENVPSIKPMIYYNNIPLFDMYEYTTKYADLSDEELEKHFNSDAMTYIHKLPKVTDTLKYKGKLRISWALDVKYNKNIDLIFFTEDNPFINYAVLYAKGSPKTYESSAPRGIEEFNVPYDINYDFVKEVFKQSLSPTQQEKFFNSRFGSVLIPMEIEFEWYRLYYYDSFERSVSETSIRKIISFSSYDEYLRLIDDPITGIDVCIGIIKSYKVLPHDTPIIFPKEILDLEGVRNIERPTFDELLTLLPTSILACTYTDIDDFIVNVRDKPSAKEGKILTQLLSQRLGYQFTKQALEEEGWSEELSDSMSKELDIYYKAQQAYYEKEKSNLINPLNRDEYIVLVWNIESNGWAKVWILRTIDGDSASDLILVLDPFYVPDRIRKFMDKPYADYVRNYKQMFLEQPSRLKLYEGYIHTSGLEYIGPFGDNYIKR